MTKHILIRLAIPMAIILLAALVFYVLCDTPAAGMGSAIIAIVTALSLGLLYIIFLLYEAFQFFRNSKNDFGILNLVIGLPLLAIVLYITNFYLYPIF